MEDILDIYETPYDPALPVICMDEKPYQLLGDVREPLPMRPGDDAKIYSEYICNGTCSIFVFVEPLARYRYVSVRHHRTAVGWADEIRHLLTGCYPDQEKIVLIMDNLNIHVLASLYKKFPASEARAYARGLEIHYTPKHGSWLNIAEIELNVMTRQCLSRRLFTISSVAAALAAWNAERNNAIAKVNWHFTTENAREKLISVYPTFEDENGDEVNE